MVKKATKKTSTRPLQACACPYCDTEVEAASSPICKPCGVTFKYCGACKLVLPPESAACPKCGKPVK